MGDFFKDVGESIANLVGAGPSGGPLGGFKPVGKILAPIVGSVAGAELAPLAGIGAGVGGAAGGALAGGLEGGIPGAVLGGAGGYFGGPTAANWINTATGLTPAGASAASSAPSAAVAAGNPVDLTSVPTGDASVLTAGGGAPVFTGPGASPPTGSVPISGDFSGGGLTTASTPADAANAAFNASLSGAVADPMTQPGSFLTPLTGTITGANPLATVTGGTPGVGTSAAGSAPSASSAAWTAFTQNMTPETAWNLIKTNPGTAIAGVGLLYNLMGSNNNAQLGELKNEAQSLQGEGAALAAGNLPPAVQTAVDNATNAAIAQIRSRYAASGQQDSTAEIQDIQQAKLNAIAMGAQFVNTGINIAGMSSDLLAQIIQLQGGQNAATGQAIANLAAALGGTTRIGGSGININVNGQPVQQAP